MIYSKVNIGDKIKCCDEEMNSCSYNAIFTVQDVQKDGWLTVIADQGEYCDKLVDVPPECFILL